MARILLLANFLKVSCVTMMRLQAAPSEDTCDGESLLIAWPCQVQGQRRWRREDDSSGPTGWL